jgi:GTP cyclohydrolase II
VRVHSECLTGDVLGAARCDCGAQMKEAIDRMTREGGILLYMRQEGRGIGLYNKLDAYRMQIAHGLDTYEANIATGHGVDERDYTAAAEMLRALGVQAIRLLTNNPDKRAQLERHGIAVKEMAPTGLFERQENSRYLRAKKDKGGHRLRMED